MTDARTKQIVEIEGLLAERRKYEQWLAQLDARKESTPSHVFAKVHADYTARLGEAQQKLSSESGAVHALAKELEDSLARQERQIAERTDERAEAELRASVGEFAGKEWEKLRGRLDSAIADLSGERESIQRELDTLRTLLSEAEPAARGAAKPAAGGEAKPAAGGEAKPATGGEAKRDIDDIAFLRSVLGRSTPYSPTLAPVVTEPPPSKAPPERPEIARVSSSARASGAAAPRASTGAASAASAASAPARPSAPELFATPEVPEGPPGPRGTDDEKPNRPSGTFGHLTPRSSEAVKSLKCQECGTLNFPTEWYCERCGGELAAF